MYLQTESVFIFIDSCEAEGTMNLSETKMNVRGGIKLLIVAIINFVHCHLIF